MSETKKLPGLNGLRAIAASLVLFGHVYQIAGLLGNTEAKRLFSSYSVGKEMVNLFFVISGFIITYILLQEQRRHGGISLRNFYIKRTLRIWPLYFLIMSLVFLAGGFLHVYDQFGHQNLNTTSFLLLTFFLVNFSPFSNAPLSVLPHYWSLSVEEQFYIFWPFLFRRFDALKTAITVIVIMALGKVGSDYMAYHSANPVFWKEAYQVLYQSSFGSIAIGAIAAVFVVRNHSCLRMLRHPIVQVGAWMTFLIAICFRDFFHLLPYFHVELQALACAIIIINITSNPKTIIQLENRFFEQAGSISYGLYMYHWPLIPVIFLVLKRLGWLSSFESFHLLPFVLLSFAVTYLVAYLSFRFVEKPLLRLKPRGYQIPAANKKYGAPSKVDF